MPETEKPIGEILRGINIDPLPEGWTVLECECMIKCLANDGKTKWALRMSKGINDEELLGALTTQLELLKRDIIKDWVDEED